MKTTPKTNINQAYIETTPRPDQSRKKEATAAEEEKQSRYPRDSTENRKQIATIAINSNRYSKHQSRGSIDKYLNQLWLNQDRPE